MTVMRRRAAMFVPAVAILLGAAPPEQPRARMVEASRAAVAAEANARSLQDRAGRAVGTAARARAEAAALAGAVQAAEAALAASQARLTVIEELRRRQRARLAERQGRLIDLIAALQTMARRPPALILVSRGDLETMVRTRGLLDAVMPEIGRRTAALRVEIEAGNRLHAVAAATAAQHRLAEARLRQKRTQLVALEGNQRRAAQSLATRALFEGDRALVLGTEARDLRDLVGRLDRQAAVRRALETLPGPILRPRVPAAVIAALPRDATTIMPATPQVQAPRAFRLPALGEVVVGFGEISDAGVRARGITLATAAGAQVVSPAAGRVAYAGPFRTFGNIVIVEHDDDWTTLVTGLGSVAVAVGDRVDAGGPIGRMANRKGELAVELRRDGSPVDPLPLMLGTKG